MESVNVLSRFCWSKDKTVSGSLLPEAKWNISQASAIPWLSQKNLVVVVFIAVQDHHSHPETEDLFADFKKY